MSADTDETTVRPPSQGTDDLDPENMTRRERIEHLAASDSPAADLARDVLDSGLVD